MTLVATILSLFVAGALFLLAGIYLMLGLPWALITAGFVLLGAAAVLRRGLTNG